jgi:hypothetical protein
MSRIARRLHLALATAIAIAIVASATPAYADSGGGCAWTNNSQVCISVHSGTTNPLYFDYYVYPGSEYLGDASVEWLCGGSYSYTYLGQWSPTWGHSPVYSRYKKAGYDRARTFVHFFSGSGVYLYTGYSPWQYW